jgi:hypothetical protein
MATSFKSLGTNDIVTTRTLLHEAIPITGSIVSGTYTDENIKDYAHGMFQSVYDYPYLSSSANHIFDITLGYSPDSLLSSSTNVQNSKKINIYNQMAQILMGNDVTGAIKNFTNKGVDSGSFMGQCIFLCFSRLLNKDEIKKGSFNLELGLSGSFRDPAVFNRYRAKITDYNAQNDYRVNSPAGEYGILYISSSTTQPLDNPFKSGVAESADDTSVGLIFYQAGIAVLTGAMFLSHLTGGLIATAPGRADGLGFISGSSAGLGPETASGSSFLVAVTGSEISASADGLRHRIYDLSFNNTTELNSTIYFCRAGHSDFNYSSNPTYLSASKLVVKNQSTDSPVSYITSVGLYSADNELLASAKLSEPLKKTPDVEFVIRTRLDY